MNIYDLNVFNFLKIVNDKLFGEKFFGTNNNKVIKYYLK